MDVIAERARNPVVARRARAFIRVRDQRAADARARAEAGARRRTLLTEGVDALEHASDPARARAELDRLEAEFAALAGDAGSADDAARFAGRVAVQRARLDAIEQAEAAAAAERAARTAGIEAREALIARAAEDAEDLDAHLAGLLSEWSALPSLAGGDDGSWTRRFADTGEQTRSRAAARARAAAVHDDVVALVGRIEALVAPDVALEESERAWPVLESEWKALTAPLEIDAELSARVRRVADMFAERRRSRQADAAKIRDHRLETWKALAARAGAVAAQPDAPMRDVDQAVRDLKAVLEPQAGGSGGGESTKGAPPDAIAAELRTSLAALSTRLRELRDAEDWRRWANAGIQEALVGQVEALKSSKDLPNVARQLRDLRRQWKAVSAGRDESGALWQRFKSAADELQARCDEQARLVAAEQAVHLAARVTLCESAEALAQSTDWVTTAETLKQLQAQWAAAGPAPRDQVAELARRFRTACDTFFTRRKTDLASLKQAWSENASKKEALCAQAEALAESTDWQAALDRHQAAPGGLEGGRPGAPQPRRAAVEALPRRLRQVLRALRLASPDRRAAARRAARGRGDADRGARRRGRRGQPARGHRRHRPGSVDAVAERRRAVRRGRAPRCGPASTPPCTRWSARRERPLPDRASTSARRSRAAPRSAKRSRPRSSVPRSRPRPVPRRRRRWPRCCANHSPPTPSAAASTRTPSCASWRTRSGGRSSSGGTSARPSARRPWCSNRASTTPCAASSIAIPSCATRRPTGRARVVRRVRVAVGVRMVRAAIAVAPVDPLAGEAHGRTDVRARRARDRDPRPVSS